jgi:hypothetical protein
MRAVTSRDELGSLLKKAAAAMKGDMKGAVGALEQAYELASASGDAEDTAVIAEELARAWARRKSSGRALYYARKSTTLAPAQKATWTTLAKTCELIASRQHARGASTEGRARALYRASAHAFKKAASLSKDAEDRRWLLELAGDAAKQGKA